MTRFFLPLLLVALVLSACPGADSDIEDVVKPHGVDSYVGETSTPGCLGAGSVPGIDESHHQQCSDWGITSCTNTTPSCCQIFSQNPASGACCCNLCGIAPGSGESVCFNLVCPPCQ